MRGQITSKQLRDDLMTMLIAGHETTAAVLTWTLFCLTKRPDILRRMQLEVAFSKDGSPNEPCYHERCCMNMHTTTQPIGPHISASDCICRAGQLNESTSLQSCLAFKKVRGSSRRAEV